jgi:hypothetical protein
VVAQHFNCSTRVNVVSADGVSCIVSSNTNWSSEFHSLCSFVSLLVSLVIACFGSSLNRRLPHSYFRSSDQKGSGRSFFKL